MSEELDPTVAPEVEAPEVEVEPEVTDFTPEYVHKLRDEAAEYRTNLKPYEETFDGYQPEEREAFLELAQTLKRDPAAAADWMEQVAKNIRSGMGQEQAEVAAAETVVEESKDSNQSAALSAADFDRLLDERLSQREQQLAQAQSIREVEDEVRSLGVDPDSPDGLAVMQIAWKETGGDLQAAYKIAVEDRNAAIIEAYLEQKAAEAGTPGGGFQGGSFSAERDIKNLQDSKAAMLARLNAMQEGAL